jgi:YD repeat-containing protein
MRVRLTFASVLVLLTSAAFVFAQQSSSQTGASMSDRDKAGLRGPVKTVMEEHTTPLPDDKQVVTTNTTEYSPDGRKLEERWGNSDGPEWETKYTYHSDGRLSKMETGKTGSAPNSETTYLYDDARKLIGMKSGDKSQARYQYDEKGQKSLIESFEATPLPANTAYGAHWEGTDLGFANYLGGTLTTFYDEQDVATGAEFHDLEGKLVGHIVRKFDAEGRVVSEEQIADAPHQFALPEEIRSQLNAKQLKTIGAFMGGAMQNRANFFTYDEKGRVTERHRRGGPFDDEVTITKYNDYGDKISELTTTTMNPEIGKQFSLTEAGAMLPVGESKPPEPPSTYEMQYTYQFDAHGNWTEQTIAGRSHSDEAFGPGTTCRRKLTYY